MADVKINNEILEVDQKEENTERNSVDSTPEKSQPVQAENETEESVEKATNYELFKISAT